jgi:hypothetical protein
VAGAPPILATDRHDPPAPPRRCAACLSQHLRRWIDPGDALYRTREQFDADAGPEADLQHPVLRLNIEQPDCPGGMTAIGACHDDAAKTPEQPGWMAEQAPQQGSADAHADGNVPGRRALPPTSKDADAEALRAASAARLALSSTAFICEATSSMRFSASCCEMPVRAAINFAT